MDATTSARCFKSSCVDIIDYKDSRFSRESCAVLANQVWEERHEATELDRVRELTLMPSADAGALARHDLSKGGKVAFQCGCILVVNVLLICLAEVAGTICRFVTVGFLHNGCVRKEYIVRFPHGRVSEWRLKWNVFKTNFLRTDPLVFCWAVWSRDRFKRWLLWEVW